MSDEGYLRDSYEGEAASLRRQIDRLERANTDLEYQLREKERRVYELEDALDSMRRELRNVQDGYSLNRAKRHGRNAVGGFW